MGPIDAPKKAWKFPRLVSSIWNNIPVLPCRFNKPNPTIGSDGRVEDDTLINRYLHHLYAVVPSLHPEETYLAVDSYFTKKKWIDGVEAVGRYTIGKLRRDANMRFFYTGPPRSSGSGRQKTYDGKVDWQDLSRFDSITDQDGLHLYTQVLNHVSLKRPLRVSRPAGFIGSQQAALCVAVFDRCGTGCGGALSLL